MEACITIGAYDIAYREVGIGNSVTVVFAHGLGGNLEQWTKQIDYFKQAYHVIAFSLQGHGKSTKVDDQTAYTIDAYAQTAVKLLELLQVKNCIWVGNSMGGVIGYHILSNYSDLITMLITNGTTPRLVFSKTALKLVKVIDRILLRLLGFHGYVRFAANNSTKIKSVQKDIYDMMIETHPQAVIESHQLLGNYDYIKTIMATLIPIYIIQTPKDKDINRSIDRLKKDLNKQDMLTFHPLTSGGHIVNMEEPELYNGTVGILLKQ
ncbi:MAG: alpha/beta hydrolase [Vallitaleaceae bacterium]|jgi:3-oxoadipate enol-lactonase|nr:alpha/beta hydrolase [Vallitaleaceae bacterium]